MDDDRSVLLVTFSHSHSHTYTHTRTTLILYMKRTTKVITLGIITIGRVEPNINMENWCFYLVPRNSRALAGSDRHRFPLPGPKPNMGEMGVLYGSWDASTTRNDAGI